MFYRLENILGLIKEKEEDFGLPLCSCPLDYLARCGCCNRWIDSLISALERPIITKGCEAPDVSITSDAINITSFSV